MTPVFFIGFDTFYSNMDEVQLRVLVHYEDVIRLQARTSLILSGQSADRFTQLARVFFGTLRCVSDLSLFISCSHDANIIIACILFHVFL
jgi:hypothetical protein